MLGVRSEAAVFQRVLVMSASGPSSAIDLGSLPVEAHQPRHLSFQREPSERKWWSTTAFSHRGLKDGLGCTILRAMTS